MLRLLRFALLVLIGMQAWAASATSYPWYSLNDNKKATINVELFLSTTCAHCHKADAFFREIEAKEPWLHVKRNYINENKEALILFNQLLTEQHYNDFAVPSIFFCNSRWVGFDSASTTGEDILKGLKYCRQQVEQKGDLTEAAQSTIKHWANANMFNSGITEQPSTLHYLLVVTLLDVTNPCALFGLAAFFAVLLIQYSRKNQWISGFLVILAIALVHILQQTQASVFFQLLAWARPAALVLGIVTLYIVFLYYKKQPLKPYLFFIWAFFFTVFVQSYQQTCIMNWSYVFQQWLHNQQLAVGQKLVMQLIYQILYIMPLIVLLWCYMMVQKVQRFTTCKPFLATFGLCLISIISFFLIIYPMAMAHFLPSLLVLILAFIAIFISYRY